MAFNVKQWLNGVGSGTSLDAPNTGAETHLDAAGLRDLEQRLSDYSTTLPGPQGAAGAAGAQGAQGPKGDPSVYVQQAQPVNPPIPSLWVETDGANPPNIVAIHVAVA